MATWPANGVTDWNTKMLAYLAISFNTDGTLKADAAQTTSGAAKGFARVNAAGVLQTGSLNVTSTAKDDTGKYTVTWDTNFDSADYIIITGTESSAGHIATVFSRAAGSCVITTYTHAGAAADVNFDVVAFGTLV